VIRRGEVREQRDTVLFIDTSVRGSWEVEGGGSQGKGEKKLNNLVMQNIVLHILTVCKETLDMLKEY